MNEPAINIEAAGLTAAAPRPGGPQQADSALIRAALHRDPRTVRGYIRRANLFKGHAGAGFL